MRTPKKLYFLKCINTEIICYSNRSSFFLRNFLYAYAPPAAAKSPSPPSIGAAAGSSGNPGGPGSPIH